MNAALSHVRPRWPHLSFTEAGQTRLDEVETFLRGLIDRKVPLAEDIAEQFYERMQYLDDFGGTISESDPRRRFRVTLGRDFAPMSFTITWEGWDRALNDYRFSFQGALIWHGGSNDPLCVSLTPQWWGIHT